MPPVAARLYRVVRKTGCNKQKKTKEDLFFINNLKFTIMKKLIFCLVVLLASAGIASAQLNGTYTGTATDLIMGGPVSGTYDATTTFSSNAMTAMTMDVAGHTVELTTPATFTQNGSTYDWNGDGVGTVTTPYGTYIFEVTYIDLWSSNSGKLVYHFEAEVPALNDMLIYFTFTVN